MDRSILLQSQTVQGRVPQAGARRQLGQPANVSGYVNAAGRRPEPSARLALAGCAWPVVVAGARRRPRYCRARTYVRHAAADAPRPDPARRRPQSTPEAETGRVSQWGGGGGGGGGPAAQ
ncbi:hypothetical protein EVAR_82370_1 [Eumeta japonica]|uniref:Uncharacterized protein n=1 Tax=Eumeta variegata TaxID=151549 RepID=A0A4C1U9W7_EUMVA|nr:hypothetical protein EVAR_82370_1 [Eumeta japonica]